MVLGMAVTSAGPYADNLHLASDREPHQHLITQCLQSGCYSWHSANHVKALKVCDLQYAYCKMTVWLCTAGWPIFHCSRAFLFIRRLSRAPRRQLWNICDRGCSKMTLCDQIWTCPIQPCDQRELKNMGEREKVVEMPQGWLSLQENQCKMAGNFLLWGLRREKAWKCPKENCHIKKTGAKWLGIF